MCKIDLYPFFNADGTQGSRYEKHKCDPVRRGEACQGRQVFRHQAPTLHLPPSPLSTPRSTTPNYRSSGDESGGSGGSARRQRRSGLYATVEVNGRRIYEGVDPNRSVRRRSHQPTERVVVVDSPPTARTPPQAFTMPRTAPPSPSPLDSARRMSSSGYRPIIVDERRRHAPLVTINTTQFAHRRTPSSGSHHSRGSSASEDAMPRYGVFAPATTPRRPTQAEMDREEEFLRQQRLAARISAANAEINRRPAVPMPPTPPQRSSSTYVRPAVEVRSSVRARAPPAAAERLTYAEREKMRQDEEEEAQRQRLRERMTPQRRATIGGGSRRTRIVYPDGVYRWE